ncbi:ATP-dependent zinc metalloprotease FtsH [Candidatus Acetothermia bacterium]|nr:ATP-dependent zinc metalloprotease FtsH [Candidatus Acetothermia bacterium]MCI2426240.1 ATP-dependent zinc metalloprotease FtsH [Candidatus Acetothermia bacterium]MCI2427641.1 ATP-dependent zinc metalloprotease FtsH [Candidatus Acetothermia bacterium]MCI2428606.1 ATP-dependent zinc metalloprotease FtsH [Candidatus Acetothermia bacterium]
MNRVEAVPRTILSLSVAADNRGTVKLLDGRRLTVQLPPDASLYVPQVLARGIDIQFEPHRADWVGIIFGPLLWILLLAGVWIYIMRRAQRGVSGPLSFGASKARLTGPETTGITFKDVAGIDEVAEEVQEIVQYLRNPRKFVQLGAEIPKGILLVGAPGTGKTYLAKAIAGEANVPFFSISGSDFVEMFVGVGAARVRDMFVKAKANVPCIIFIDEIDAVGRKRGTGLGGGHDEREQTLNQLLAEMDGFQPNKGIVILAATNRPDVLDPALLRPGRFDRKITVPRPDLTGREAILRLKVANKPLAADVNLAVMARRTPGFVGADLENLANEAALLAARHGKKEIEMIDFEESIDRVLAGIKRKGIVLTGEERERIAYHESGHAVVGRILPKADPVHRVSIIPRGDGTLGFTLQIPLEERYLVSKDELLDKLTSLFGGRAAEEVVYNDFSTGAYDDLKKATELAKRLVVEYGMSEKLGPISLSRNHADVFLGEEIIKGADHSEALSSLVDSEIRSILHQCYDRAKKLLQENRGLLDKLTKALLVHEVLSGNELEEIFSSALLAPAG